MLGQDTVVTLEFNEHPDGTELILTQEGFTDETVRGDHDKGWVSSFVCLDEFV